MSWRQYVPKIVTVWREGYGFGDFRRDCLAGLTVAIVALPLAMALGIASGTTPDKGLLTAVVAGFIISALGGSRVQIGGPTGAFVVVVANVIHTFGYDGLVLATLMAGVILVIAGAARLGTWVKYMPEPVVTGFTAGIAVIIFTSQLKDLFGLSLAEAPPEFAQKLMAFWTARDTATPAAMLIAGISLALIIALRRFAPRAPAFLIAVVGASVAAMVFGLQVDTIGSQFGDLPRSLPAPALPSWDAAKLRALIPSALTIAFLAGVESLLSAVVADGMTGYRHRSNAELVGQGVANIASALFGGMPATGAIARTATNIRAGARSPVAGMMHAVFLLAFMMVAAPLANYVPLAVLAAVLTMVAWNMSDAPRVLHLLSAPLGDRVVLILTFSLTVLVDLTVAIEVGVVLASILFMHRMAQVAGIGRDGDDDEGAAQRTDLPPGIEVYQFQGPLFFGVTNRLTEVLQRTAAKPKAFILRMRLVPLIDASGVSALAQFLDRCRKDKTVVIFAGLQPDAEKVMQRMGVFANPEGVWRADGYAQAIEMAREIPG